MTEATVHQLPIRRPVVDVEGPYDDRPHTELALDGSLALALTQHPLPLPGDEADAPATAPCHGVGPARRERVVALAPAVPQAHRFVRHVLEVLAGDRPVRQLMYHATLNVCDELAVLVQPRGPRPWAGTVQRVVVTEPLDGVAEVAAVVRRGARATALALRMEWRSGRWRLTAVELGC